MAVQWNPYEMDSEKLTVKSVDELILSVSETLEKVEARRDGYSMLMAGVSLGILGNFLVSVFMAEIYSSASILEQLGIDIFGFGLLIVLIWVARSEIIRFTKGGRILRNDIDDLRSIRANLKE